MSPMSSINVNPLNSLGNTESLGRDGGQVSQGGIKKVAEDFESLFASQILKEMRKTLDPETMFGGDSGDVYGGLFDMFLGQQMAQNGGFGLAKMLTEAMPRKGK